MYWDSCAPLGPAVQRIMFQPAARIVLARPENYTLAVGLYVWGSDERNAPWSLFAAGAVVAAVPIIALFMYLQRYIVSGLTAGGVKG